MKICEDCPEDLTGTPANTKLCRDCANERQRERVRQQKRKRLCKFCKKELIKPVAATKFCPPCAKIRRYMTNKELLAKNISHEIVKPVRGAKVAAKIADAVAKDKSYCMDSGSPYY